MRGMFTGLAIVSGLVLLLSGCSGGANHDDLSRFMDEVRAKPKGQIKPLPTFTPYESFTYSAGGLRSPFEPPIKIQAIKQRVNSDIKPDANRVKQFLENFPVDSFSMVGTLSNSEGIWGLVRTEGSVYRIRVGDYIGRNHGRIIAITETGIQLLEIIPSGPESWVERPKTLTLTEQ